MIENCPILSINVKIFLFFSFIRTHTYRRYIAIGPFLILNVSQWLFIFTSLTVSLDTTIFSGYFTILFFCALVRAIIIVRKQDKFERLMESIEDRYKALEQSKNVEILNILDYYTAQANRFSKMNLLVAVILDFTMVAFPLVQFKRVLPFNMYLPMDWDVTQPPYYEIVYVYQFLMVTVGGFFYIPYSNIFISFIAFGLIQVKVLQIHLAKITNGIHKKTGIELQAELKACIKTHIEIYGYIDKINELFSFMSLVEFLCFGILMCALLFLLAIVNTFVLTMLVISYIGLILFQLFTFYYASDKLAEEGYKVGTAAYSTDWYKCNVKFKKYLCFMIMRSQKPMQIHIGDMYLMNLVKFQAILNTSYSYFTLLNKVK